MSKRRVSAVQQYMDEPICYGGEWMVRSLVIAEMARAGMTRRQQDLWFFGYERYAKTLVVPTFTS